MRSDVALVLKHVMLTIEGQACDGSNDQPQVVRHEDVVDFPNIAHHACR